MSRMWRKVYFKKLVTLGEEDPNEGKDATPFPGFN